MKLARLLVVLSALSASSAFAVNYCGGIQHQNTCGRGNIYPCCDNGSNCTWWAWEMMCRNWGIGTSNWGNANTWGAHARVDPRFDVVGATPGAVATSTLGNYGHVAWTIGAGGGAVQVTEQNCCSTCSGSVLTRNYPASKFNSGYVIPKGSQCECSPGQQQAEVCGDCGRRVRTCGSNCAWGGFTACAGPDPDNGNQVCASGKLGVCEDARKRCIGGNLACKSFFDPSPERCDGLDNDCDGQTDEGNPEEGAADRDYAARRVDGSWPRALAAGTSATIWVEFTNVGKKTWQRGDVWLAVKGSSEAGVSRFSSPEWPAYDLASGVTQPVATGETGRFSFTITAPNTPGATISETFFIEGAGREAILCPDGEQSITLLVLNADGTTATEVDAGAPGSHFPDAGPQDIKLESRGCAAAPSMMLLGLAGLLLRRRSIRRA